MLKDFTDITPKPIWKKCYFWVVAGIALILGIDRFMSKARALTNFVGNAVATFAVAK